MESTFVVTPHLQDISPLPSVENEAMGDNTNPDGVQSLSQHTLRIILTDRRMTEQIHENKDCEDATNSLKPLESDEVVVVEVKELDHESGYLEVLVAPCSDTGDYAVFNLENLKENDRVGVNVNENGELTIFINQISQGVACSKINRPVWAVIGFDGMAIDVSIEHTMQMELSGVTALQGQLTALQNQLTALEVQYAALENQLAPPEESLANEARDKGVHSVSDEKVQPDTIPVNLQNAENIGIIQDTAQEMELHQVPDLGVEIELATDAPPPTFIYRVITEIGNHFQWELPVPSDRVDQIDNPLISLTEYQFPPRSLGQRVEYRTDITRSGNRFLPRRRVASGRVQRRNNDRIRSNVNAFLVERRVATTVSIEETDILTYSAIYRDASIATRIRRGQSENGTDARRQIGSREPQRNDLSQGRRVERRNGQGNSTGRDEPVDTEPVRRPPVEAANRHVPNESEVRVTKRKWEKQSFEYDVVPKKKVPR